MVDMACWRTLLIWGIPLGVCSVPGCGRSSIVDSPVDEAPGDPLEYPDIDDIAPHDQPGCAHLTWLPNGLTIGALSADGGTLVATLGLSIEDHRGEAVVWMDGDVLRLGPGTAAVDVSANGQVIVGNALHDDGRRDVLRWTLARHNDVAPAVEVIQTRASVVAVSDDGRVVVGHAEQEPQAGLGLSFRPFVWTQSGGRQWLDGRWAVTAATPDATSIVGVQIREHTSPFPCTICRVYEGYRWSDGEITTRESTIPIAISEDATVTAGRDDAWFSAYRWSADEEYGSEELEFSDFSEFFAEPLDPDDYSDRVLDPLAESNTILSRDGSAVFVEGAIWRGGDDVRGVSDVLIRNCIDPADLVPQAVWEVHAISGDGRTLAGCAKSRESSPCWVLSNVEL